MTSIGPVCRYGLVSREKIFSYLCRGCILLSFFSGACAVGLLWALYPVEYDYGKVRQHLPA